MKMQIFVWRPQLGLSYKRDDKWARASVAFAAQLCGIVNAIVFVAGAALIIGLFAYYLRKSSQAQYFTSYSLLEEASYTFTSANNYLHFGYLNSWLLQDFATSPFAADHPYVYNHMPPGPDLVTSALLWLTGSSYVLVRDIFASSTIVGFVIFFLFGRMLLHNFGVRFSGILLMLVSPWVIIQLFDRQVYSPNILFVFLPLLLMLYYLRDGTVGHFLTALVLIALFAFYIEYSMLAAVIFCWGMLYATQLMPLKLRHLVAVGAAFSVGIGVHLLQNMLFLGWENFLLELKLAISNRITGFPTQEQLKDFYHRLGVVHHGSHPIESSAIKAQIRANFVSPIFANAVLMLASCLAWVVSSHGFRLGDAKPIFIWGAVKSELWLFFRLTAWVVVTVMAPIILFPAFAQEVNLRGSGAQSFFFAIPLTFLTGYSLWVLAYAGHATARILIDPANVGDRPTANISEVAPAVAKLGIVAARAAAVAGIFLAFLGGSITVFVTARNEVAHIRSLGSNSDKWAPLYDIRQFDGELFMTNINVPTVGFLTKAPGFGTCGPNSVTVEGRLQLNDCKTAFMRRYGYWSTQRPRYFFYFTAPELFPGFADCVPADLGVALGRGRSNCMHQLLSVLAGHYPLVMKNHFVSVFDLGKGPPASGVN